MFLEETKLCPDQLFNISQSWETEDPQISRCLQDTFLTAIPAAFLAFLGPIGLTKYSLGATNIAL